MNKYRIIFSPTGGTEKVANTMTKFWNEVKDIDLSKTDLDFSSISLTKEDIAVIAMPSFWWSSTTACIRSACEDER